MSKVLRIIANIWIVANMVLFLFSSLIELFTKGVGAFIWFFLPWNYMNFIMLMITLSPGIILLKVAEKLEKKKIEKGKKRLIGLYDVKTMSGQEIYDDVMKRVEENKKK